MVTTTPALGFLPSFLRSLRDPSLMPEGINNFSDPLPSAHPVPVVLIHGTWLNVYNSFAYLAQHLTADGYRVFASNYGKDTSSLAGRLAPVYANGPLLQSQRELAAFIDEVLERTGAPQVDLIGHSQGVAQARLYLTDSGGAAGSPTTATLGHTDAPQNRVRKLIGIGGSNHGTTLCGLSPALDAITNLLGVQARKRSEARVRALFGQAALDQKLGAECIAHLNRHGDTVPGVDYLMICSRFDQIVTPWRSQRLTAGPGARVRNVLIQTGNIKDLSDHLAILYSPRVLDLIREELAGPDPAYRETHPLVRAAVLPGFGEVRWNRRWGQWRRRK